MLLGLWYLLQQPEETGIWRRPALGLGWPGEVWVGEWPKVYGGRWQNPRLPPNSPPPRKEQIVPWRDWSGKSLSGFASLSRKQGQGTEQDAGGRACGRLNVGPWPLLISCLQHPELPPPLSPPYPLGRRLQGSSLEKRKGPKDMNSRHWGHQRRAQDRNMNWGASKRMKQERGWVYCCWKLNRRECS